MKHLISISILNYNFDTIYLRSETGLRKGPECLNICRSRLVFNQSTLRRKTIGKLTSTIIPILEMRLLDNVAITIWFVARSG